MEEACHNAYIRTNARSVLLLFANVCFYKNLGSREHACHTSRFHAAQRIPHLTLEVRVASDFTSRHGELIPVTEMYFHPNFNHESLSNNLAMLKLKKRLKFSQKVRKIMIDDRASKMPENAENIFILGWGTINVSTVI